MGRLKSEVAAAGVLFGFICHLLRFFTLVVSEAAAWLGLGCCHLDLNQADSQKLKHAQVISQPGVKTRLPYALDGALCCRRN